jgi:thiosulfate/3-mercaptopyruvate sulfurtransferase
MLLALKLAGVKNVKSYFSGWNDWSRDPSLPIEEGYPEDEDNQHAKPLTGANTSIIH